TMFSTRCAHSTTPMRTIAPALSSPSWENSTHSTFRTPNTHLCRKPMTNRLDRVMRGLEALQNDADGIIDAHVNAWLAEHPEAVFGGETKLRFVPIPAGMTINRVEALRLLRRGLTEKA